jgi:hypothetical protein
MTKQTHLAHFEHTAFNYSLNTCPRCNAERERRFAYVTPFHYEHVHEYLSWAKPRVEAIRAGNTEVNARQWQRDFVRALHKRISSRGSNPVWRKRNDSYLERLRGMKHVTDAGYLRSFAARGASCLD